MAYDPAGARTSSTDLFIHMYIQNTNTDVQTLHDASLMPDGYEVNFNENGVAQVKEDVGQALISEFDSITEYQNE